MAAEAEFMDKLTALCKRRGFIYQSSEIYGGIGGFWDYGPLGVELKRNIKDLWWHDMVTNPPIGPDGKEIQMVGVDCSIIMNPRVWEASGHVGGFADPMIDCKECKSRFRADQIYVVPFYLFDLTEPDTSGEIVALIRVAETLNKEGLAREEVARQSAELRRLIDSKFASGLVPKYMKSVLASDPMSARFAAELSARERKHLGDSKQRPLLEGNPHTVENHPSAWPPPPCPSCGASGALTEPRAFNLMFKTHYGALEDKSSLTYLRPETAQGIFVNYQNVLDTTRVKVPFGIAQIGKAFRNEINPRNYTFRSREFEQMEIEFFCRPETSMEWYEFWRKVRYDWYVNLGLKSEKLRLRDQTGDELAHYSKACADIEYMFPFSDEFQELEGVAHRGDYDLTRHQEHSGKDLTYLDNDAWERDKDRFPDKEAARKAKQSPPYRFIPHVVEPSAGVDRAALAFLCEAYTEDQAPDDKGQMQKRVVMKFHPKLAPTKVAVFPLVNREGMPDVAEAIYKDVKRHVTAFYDDRGAIGRRYRRQDEVGTPFCVTVDGDTLKDGTVTIRDRGSLEQVRVKKEGVVQWLRKKVQSSE